MKIAPWLLIGTFISGVCICLNAPAGLTMMAVLGYAALASGLMLIFEPLPDEWEDDEDDEGWGGSKMDPDPDEPWWPSGVTPDDELVGV